jgi:ABC-type glycerol-3-phosphate transport system permease component
MSTAISLSSSNNKKWNFVRLKRMLGDIILHLILILVALFMILPFLWMLTTSFKPPEDVFRYPPVIISENSSFYAYISLIVDQLILRNVWNSFFVASAATLLSLFFCSLGGYGFAKFKFPGRDALFIILLGTMVIPQAVTIVPLYVTYLRFGWLNSFYGLIIPGAANAFGIFFMRQYITTVSSELLDAARIDGSGEFGIYWRVIVPIIRPGLMTLGLIFFMNSWNSYLWPLILLKNPELFTLPLSIRMQVAPQQGIPIYPFQMASSVISIIPLLIIFLIFQRRFVEGITAGAIKG